MMSLKEKRVEVLNDIERLLKERCEKCMSSGNNASIWCECYASVGLRKCGDELLRLTKPRTWDKKLDQVKKEGTLTLREYTELLKYGVTRSEVANVLGIVDTKLSDWCNYYGLTAKVRRSEEKSGELLKKHGNVKLITSGFSYASEGR